MSWMPSNDPVLGDAASCDALDLVVVPRVRDLGGFSVRRALPQVKRQMVGPFIFFDQMGPVQFVPGQGMDVRPHPHIGLATVTYLFDGRITHRDSEGNALDITPGAMNLMTAGRGIAHSERTPPDARTAGAAMSGIQSWVALPAALEETDPGFQHFNAATLPVVADGGVWARVIAGSAFGQTSPVRTLSEWLYAEVLLDAGASAPLDPDQEERAIYVVEGAGPHRWRDVRRPRPAGIPSRRPHHRHGDWEGAAYVPRRRGIGRTTPYLVELRVVAPGPHRSGEGRLEGGPVPGRLRRDRVHPSAGVVMAGSDTAWEEVQAARGRKPMLIPRGTLR